MSFGFMDILFRVELVLTKNNIIGDPTVFEWPNCYEVCKMFSLLSFSARTGLA